MLLPLRKTHSRKGRGSGGLLNGVLVETSQEDFHKVCLSVRKILPGPSSEIYQARHSSVYGSSIARPLKRNRFFQHSSSSYTQCKGICLCLAYFLISIPSTVTAYTRCYGDVFSQHQWVVPQIWGADTLFRFSSTINMLKQGGLRADPRRNNTRCPTFHFTDSHSSDYYETDPEEPPTRRFRDGRRPQHWIIVHNVV